MPYRVDGSDLFQLAKAFGEDGIAFAVDAANGAVAAATEAAGIKLRECLRRRWPKSSVSGNVRTTQRSSPAGIIGIVSVAHDWIGVLALGENVRPHGIVARGEAMRIPIAKKKHPEEAINPVGGAIFRRRVAHPGYEGEDCVSPAEKFGATMLDRLLRRAAAWLALKLARGGGAGG